VHGHNKKAVFLPINVSLSRVHDWKSNLNYRPCADRSKKLDLVLPRNEKATSLEFITCTPVSPHNHFNIDVEVFWHPPMLPGARTLPHGSPKATVP